MPTNSTDFDKLLTLWIRFNIAWGVAWAWTALVTGVIWMRHNPDYPHIVGHKIAGGMTILSFGLAVISYLFRRVWRKHGK